MHNWRLPTFLLVTFALGVALGWCASEYQRADVLHASWIMKDADTMVELQDLLFLVEPENYREASEERMCAIYRKLVSISNGTYEWGDESLSTHAKRWYESNAAS